MKIILLEDIDKLGKEGDVVDVAAGYARNYLLAKKKALLSTSGNMKRFEEIKKLLKNSLAAQGFRLFLHAPPFFFFCPT